MVASNVTTFNMADLAASTGTSAGTILEFDSVGNMLPTTGTYKTVLASDTAIAAINVPNYFWFTDPTLSGATEYIFNPIPWLSWLEPLPKWHSCLQAGAQSSYE